ncbi:MAG: hypothetical protein AAB462_02275 [Patescibacteria group bacterium]
MSESTDHGSGENNEDQSPVVAALQAVNTEEAKSVLDSQHGLDPKAGIIIAKLDELPAIESPEVGVSPYELYAARVMPSGHVNPHRHNIGTEPYHFLSGVGEMNIGHVEGETVTWQEPQQTTAGTTFVVEAGAVHSLRNPDPNAPLDFLFASPPEHLSDNSPENPSGDRYFVQSLPPQYP